MSRVSGFSKNVRCRMDEYPNECSYKSGWRLLDRKLDREQHDQRDALKESKREV